MDVLVPSETRLLWLKNEDDQLAPTPMSQLEEYDLHRDHCETRQCVTIAWKGHMASKSILGVDRGKKNPFWIRERLTPETGYVPGISSSVWPKVTPLTFLQMCHPLSQSPWTSCIHSLNLQLPNLKIGALSQSIVVRIISTHICGPTNNTFVPVLGTGYTKLKKETKIPDFIDL